MSGPGTFISDAVLPVGDAPTSIEVVDLDADGDLDLAVVAIDIEIGPGVQAFQNIGINQGDLVFEEPVAFSVNADPNFVVSTDSVPERAGRYVRHERQPVLIALRQTRRNGERDCVCSLR